MRVRDKLEQRVRGQFGRPTGLFGRVAGWIMAHRSSNRRRNAWVVSLLDVRPDDRVLELGFGPGLAIEQLSRRAVDGYVCGIDHSDVMVRQATKRNARAIERGRVHLRLGSVEDLPAFETGFDKVLAVNAMLFWAEPVERLRELRQVLRRGGRIAIAFQPRGAGAGDQAAARTGEKIAAALTDAGFTSVRIETLTLKPAVVCVLGTNGSARDDAA